MAIANGTEFGLATSIWTRDVARAHRVAHALQCGIAWINDHHRIDPASPWGGFKMSGIGRENGLVAYEEYTQIQNIIVNLSDASSTGMRMTARPRGTARTPHAHRHSQPRHSDNLIEAIERRSCRPSSRLVWRIRRRPQGHPRAGLCLSAVRRVPRPGRETRVHGSQGNRHFGHLARSPDVLLLGRRRSGDKTARLVNDGVADMVAAKPQPVARHGHHSDAASRCGHRRDGTRRSRSRFQGDRDRDLGSRACKLAEAKFRPVLRAPRNWGSSCSHIRITWVQKAGSSRLLPDQPDRQSARYHG